MNNQASMSLLAAEIRQIYRTNSRRPERHILGRLERDLAGHSLPEKISVIQELIDLLSEEEAVAAESATKVQTLSFDEEAFSVLVSLLLGKNIDDIEGSPQEILERLADSLNMIFDSLNELIRAINTTFAGDVSGDKTIRLVVSSNMEGADGTMQLKSYLDQVKDAFSVMYDGFKEAANTKMREVLDEINPEAIANLHEHSRKVGPFRKAELFELYEEKFKTLDNWLEKGFYTEALLREFEKISQARDPMRGGTNE